MYAKIQCVMHFIIVACILAPSLPGSAKMAASSTRSKSEGLRLIYNELVACCPTGVTNREGVVQLCERLRYDPLDTQV